MNTRRRFPTETIERLESRTMLAADLAISVALPAAVTAGTDASFVFTVVNNGTSTANGIKFTPTVGYPANCTQLSFTQTSTGVQGLVRPHQSVVETLVLEIGSNITTGTVLDFPMMVTTKNESAATLADNTVEVTTSPVLTSADLNLVITGPAKVTAGTTATFDFSTFNNGPSLEPSVYYTPPDGFPDGITQLSFTLVSGSALAPGYQNVYALVLSIPSTIPDNTEISFPAELSPGVTDPNLTNDTADVTTTVVSQAVAPVNIALASSAFNDTSTTGQAVGFTATITPVATGTTPTGTVTFTEDGNLLGTETVESDGTATLPTSTAYTAGNHTIIASYSGDSTYGATTKSLTQVINAPTPSQVVPTFGKITLPTSVVSGATFKSSLPVTLTNDGAAQTGIFKVQLYVNTVNTLDGNQVAVGPLVQTRYVLGIDRHTPVIAFRLTTLPASLPAGTYFVIAEMTDSNGLDNSVATTQTITTAAPFVSLSATVSAVTPSTIKPKQSGSITITLTNAGNIDATGALAVTLSPSIDGISPVVGVTLATVSEPHYTLKANKTVKIVLHPKNAGAATAGTYFPYVAISLAGNSLTEIGSTQFTLL